MEARPSMDGDASESLWHALASFEPWELTEIDALFAPEPSQDEAPDRHPTPSPRRRHQRSPETLVLETTIASLQRTIEQERAKRVRPHSDPSQDPLENEWREIAVRQADQRTAALVENAKLRVVAAAHVDGARKIVRLSRRVTELGNRLPPKPDLSPDQFRGPDLDPRDQLAQLARSADQVRDVFGVDTFRTQGRKNMSQARVVSYDPESGQGVEIEILMGWLVPFGVREVADALWVYSTPTTEGICAWVVHEEPRAEVSRFIVAPQADMNQLLVHGQTAKRRSLASESDGSIELYTNVRGRVVNPKSGDYTINVDDWVRVESMPLSGNVKGALSRVQWCHRVRVGPSRHEMMTRQERVAWAHRLVTGRVKRRVEQDLARNIQSIENLLLTPHSNWREGAGHA